MSILTLREYFKRVATVTVLSESTMTLLLESTVSEYCDSTLTLREYCGSASLVMT